VKKFFIWNGTLFLSYAVIAGIGWFWVLDLRFSLWKLLIIAALSCWVNMVQNIVLNKYFKVERK
jgi:hypothetical protein